MLVFCFVTRLADNLRLSGSSFDNIFIKRKSKIQIRDAKFNLCFGGTKPRPHNYLHFGNILSQKKVMYHQINNYYKIQGRLRSIVECTYKKLNPWLRIKDVWSWPIQITFKCFYVYASKTCYGQIFYRRNLSYANIIKQTKINELEKEKRSFLKLTKRSH